MYATSLTFKNAYFSPVIITCLIIVIAVV